MASAWEADTRLTVGCLVCREAAARAIEVPRLPDVHVTYGYAALCPTCEVMAMGDDRAGLTDRWRSHAHSAPDDADRDVRSVLAWAGHVHLAEPVPREYRDPDPAPLSGVDAERWAELGPRVRGRDARQVRFVGRVEGGPGIWHDGARVTRDGYRVRSETDDGTFLHVTDGVTDWRVRDGVATAKPLRTPAEHGSRLHELDHRTDHEVERFGFGQPLGPIEPVQFLDRAAWRFRFAAPAHKPYDMRVIVDDLTGLVLEQRFGPDHVTRWTEFRTDVDPDPALFTWTGPTEVVDEAGDRMRTKEYWAAEDKARESWFADHVAAALSVPAGPVDVVLYGHAADDGGFHAGLRGAVAGSLSRRPRSEAWWELEWPVVHHRWSDDRFGWALNGDDGPLDDDVVAALRRQLSQGR